MKFIIITFLSIFIAGCGVVGDNNIEIAQYEVLKKSAAKPAIELRHYPRLVLVSTSMNEGERNSAFGRLFKYISGNNVGETNIEMTAPVLMDKNSSKGVEIPMTAPVFMDASDSDQPMMSFVLPAEYTIETAPQPTDANLNLSEIKDYTVAAIIFNGRLSDGNILKHQKILETWIAEQRLTATGAPKIAGYNAPFTLPMLRRNEVLIPIEKP